MTLNARNTDPETSHMASDMDPGKRQDRMVVWALFRREKRPLADFQVEALLGGANNGKWRKRRSDLSRDGFLHAVGEVMCPHTKRAQLTWALEPQAPQQPDLFSV
jgi:hypothetical protein